MDEKPKVVQLVTGGAPQAGNSGIAAKLRQYADEFERGEWGEISTFVGVVSTPERLSRITLTGGQPITTAQLIGILAFAQHQAMCDAD